MFPQVGLDDEYFGAGYIRERFHEAGMLADHAQPLTVRSLDLISQTETGLD